MEEPNLGGGLGGSAAEGNASSSMGNSVVNSRLSVDLKMLEGLNSELSKLNENTKKIKSNFKDLISNTKDLTAELNKAATAMGKVSGKSSSGYMDVSKGMPDAAVAGRQQQLADVERILGALGKGGGLPGGGGGGGGKTLGGLKAFGNNPYVQAASQFGQAAIGAIDDRVDRNKGYALSADKLSVQLQQQYGMSQMGVMNDLRGPLRKNRLGMGGINELLSMQSRTGINAQKQAGSVESIRTLMGYGTSAGDATNYIESLGQADTVNKMFMMTGTSLYGIGGKQKSAQQVNQDLIGRLGLNNRELINAGRQDGSMVRQRLQMSGLDQGAQDLLLQYAESNVSFTEKGGKGFYDPSKKSDRERMGIEGNYATQQEETTRTGINREEQMYKRQADNYAQMEKNLQAVNKALGAFEDKLSGITGARTSTRGFGQLLSPALGIAGAIVGAYAGGPMGAVAGYGIGSGIGTKLGDATGGGTASPGSIASVNPTVKKGDQNLLSQLKPVLREPLTRLLMDRPGIGIGGAYRSAEEQKSMFLSRYYKTDEKTETFYDGSYWQKKPGVAAAAPPGLSYHEIGLAADLTFSSTEDEQWLRNNASKYGLDEFSRLGEVWHVQSKAYPASRRNYEEGGASYGTEENTDTKYVIGTTGSTAETGPMGQSGMNMSYEATVHQQMSTAESIAAFSQGRLTTLLYGNSHGNSGGAGGGRNTSNQTSNDSGSSGPPKNRGNINQDHRDYYSKLQKVMGKNTISKSVVKDMLRSLSVRGKKLSEEELTKFMGFVGRETGNTWDANSLNPSASTKDLSFGLLQLNMEGMSGHDYQDMLKIHPEFKNDFSGLWDPKKNLEVAANWKMSDGMTANRNYNVAYHWDSYKSGLKKEGDPSGKGYTPTKQTGSSAPSSTKITTGPTNNNVFNINPTINVNSTGSVPMDAAKLAKEVTKLIDRELRMNIVRSS